MAEDLAAFLKGKGACLVGFADLGPVPEEVRMGLPRGVCYAMALTPSIVSGIAEGPTEEYSKEYDRVNKRLGEISRAGADWLQEKGWQAEPRQATFHKLPADLITPLPQKTLATLAGLGWIGKCALLITPEFGPALRLNSILTDAPLPTGKPVTASKCGDCRVCVEVCPGKAPSGKAWKQGMPRNDFFDAFACQEACVRIGRERGTSHLICGKCVARCPYTARWLEQNREKP